MVKMTDSLIDNKDQMIVDFGDRILVTGANGFIGTRVVETLLAYGFGSLCCFARGSGNMAGLNRLAAAQPDKVHICEGNLLSRDDCARAAGDAAVVLHLAAGMEKTFPGCYMNSVVSTRNLLDAAGQSGCLKRFVNVSSMAVYASPAPGNGNVLDETGLIDARPEERHEAYTYGKVKQDEIVLEYAGKFGINYVILRPGDVFGPGRRKISGKIGIDTFGVFFNIAGGNQVPLTYVDNCAEAIVLAGIRKGVDGEVFNIVDDDLPSGSYFLRRYNEQAARMKSIRMPYPVFYCLCGMWEKYSEWSGGQVPPVFNRKRCVAHWKKVKYTNRKLKEKLNWRPRVSMRDALDNYFKYLSSGGNADA